MATVKLRLAFQSLLRRLNNRLWTKILLAKTKGESIFEIQATLLLEKTPLHDFNAATYTETLGRYDIVDDIEIIYSKRIDEYCKKSRLDSDAVLLNTVCHEIGHAKETRLFEKAQFFRQRFKVFQGNFIIPKTGEANRFGYSPGH